MSIIVGTEKKIVFLNVHKPAPVAQATVNVIGVFSVKKYFKQFLMQEHKKY